MVQNQKKFLLFRLVVIPLLLIALTGCSQQVRFAVPDQFRDQANTYDGHWTAYTMETVFNQKVGSWKLSCKSLFEQIPLNVRDGILAVNLNENEYATNISANGRFRLEIPTSLKPDASPASVDNLTNAFITLVLQGTLKGTDPEGRFIVGISTFENRGCTSRIRYLKSIDGNSAA